MNGFFRGLKRTFIQSSPTGLTSKSALSGLLGGIESQQQIKGEFRVEVNFQKSTRPMTTRVLAHQI
jgi:hypothetical protein